MPVGQQGVFGGVAVNGAGVVDEDVDVAKAVADLGEEELGAGGGREVCLEGLTVVAGGLNRGSGVRCGAAVAMRGYRGAGFGESPGDGCSETAGSTCDQSDLAIETKEIEHAGVLHCRLTVRLSESWGNFEKSATWRLVRGMQPAILSEVELAGTEASAREGRDLWV